MKFRIYRLNSQKRKPDKDAFKEIQFLKDIRSCDDPSKVPYYKGQTNWWYDEGTNHRVVNGYIVRDFPKKKFKTWYVDFKSMAQFQSFMKRHPYMEIQTEPSDKGYPYFEPTIYLGDNE